MFNLFSQDVVYNSNELDSLVWGKINARLVSMGKKPIPNIEEGYYKLVANWQETDWLSESRD